MKLSPWIFFALLISAPITRAATASDPAAATTSTDAEAEPAFVPSYDAIDAVPHFYRTRPLQDAISLVKEAMERGALALDRTGELPFLRSFLKAFEIPLSSQLLVFSTTSLQLSLISPRNPRAIYFNEDVYVGFIPGGRVELVSIDPQLGGIFYIFDLPKTSDQPIRLERSQRCMNCHSGEDSGHIPGLVLKSVIPGPGGGSLTAYRIAQTGHQIPLQDRFGGWHVTDMPTNTEHRGNQTGTMAAGKLTLHANPPGEKFSWDRYPTQTSDLLPHLLLEHQSGFVNRVTEALYRTRTIQHLAKSQPGSQFTREQAQEIENQALGIAEYCLFQNEAALPRTGITANPNYVEAFRKNQRTVEGHSLKDLQLKSRLFRHRCSYMIYSKLFENLPAELKSKIFHHLDTATRPGPRTGLGSHLEEPEKVILRNLLHETVPGLKASWNAPASAGKQP